LDREVGNKEQKKNKRHGERKHQDRALRNKLEIEKTEGWRNR
jgi:hypothetical protein